MNPTICILLVAVLGQNPTEAEKDSRIAYLKDQAARHAIYLDTEGKKPLRFSPTPLLFYTNWSGRSSDGVSFLWLAGQRPAAMMSLSLRRPRDDVYREGASLWSAPLECRLGSDSVWAPRAAGVVAQPLPEAEPPATGKAQRLAQMRDIARRFEVTLHRNEEELTQLRVLTTPIYRYEAADNGIVDGGLFAFVTTNDPEMLLLIEAARVKSGTEVNWRYTLSRMHSAKQVVRRDGQEIWTAAHFYRDPNEDRWSGHYTEQKMGRYEAGVK